jgi:UDP-N-acetylglucosamine 2-epimerase
MSKVFFDELSIPVPDYNLEVGSGSHGAQTGAMLARIEEVLLKERPDAVIVIGDTNSTLAGALAAAKLNLPLAHVEAGLRSFRRSMPEEINRVMADHLSTWLFCPTETAVANLKREGVEQGVSNTGDVLYDSLDRALPIAQSNAGILDRLGIDGKGFALVTLHRAENTDDRERLRGLVKGLLEVPIPVVFPIHPRARAALSQLDLWEPVTRRLRLTDPVGYIDCLRLTHAAQVVITDSGGLQREASALGVPCLVARDETEWVEELQNGRTLLCGPVIEKLPTLVNALIAKGRAQLDLSPRVGACRRVCKVFETNGRKPLSHG